jgi:hypothetical protein
MGAMQKNAKAHTMIAAGTQTQVAPIASQKITQNSTNSMGSRNVAMLSTVG